MDLANEKAESVAAPAAELLRRLAADEYYVNTLLTLGCDKERENA